MKRIRPPAAWPPGAAGFLALALVVPALAVTGGSRRGHASSPGGRASSLQLTSPAFANGRAIPLEHTCEGKDISPPLAWSGVPAGTKSLALLVDDPDAPDPAAPKTTWTHWVLVNLPPADAALPAGVKATALPAGTGQGLNDWRQPGYRGPCPPVGRHRYVHHLYALDRVLEFKHPPARKDLVEAIKGHVIAEAELVGTYQKGQ